MVEVEHALRVNQDRVAVAVHTAPIGCAVGAQQRAVDLDGGCESGVKHAAAANQGRAIELYLAADDAHAARVIVETTACCSGIGQHVTGGQHQETLVIKDAAASAVDAAAGDDQIVQLYAIAVVLHHALAIHGLPDRGLRRAVGFNPQCDRHRLELFEVQVAGLVGVRRAVGQAQFICLTANQHDDVSEGGRACGAFAGDRTGLIEVGVAHRFAQRAAAAELIHRVGGGVDDDLIRARVRGQR